jgi:hypothetical protein
MSITAHRRSTPPEARHTSQEMGPHVTEPAHVPRHR